MNEFSIIVADVDPRSENQLSLERLVQLAPAQDATVHLLACDYMDQLSGDFYGVEADMRQSRAEYADKLDSWLSDKAAQLRSKDIRVETKVTWHSPRYEAIIDRANEINASLIIRSARHHSKLERLLVSATDWELIRHAPQTVWLVKKRSAADRTGLNVLAAVDPVHAEEKKLGLDQRILEAASSIANIDGGKLHLFHAWQPGAAIAPAIAAGPHVPMPIVRVDDATLGNMRKQRERLLHELSDAFDVPAKRVHLKEGAVTNVLDDVVHQYDIDVVVAGGMSRGRLERLVIGSTAEAILESVDCDVVVVKPEKHG